MVLLCFVLLWLSCYSCYDLSTHVIIRGCFTRHRGNDRPKSQIEQCNRQISHNAPVCNRNVHTCAHFCYKMVHCGIWDWCIMEFVQQVCWYDCPNASEITLKDMGKIEPCQTITKLNKAWTMCVILGIYCIRFHFGCQHDEPLASLVTTTRTTSVCGFVVVTMLLMYSVLHCLYSVGNSINTTTRFLSCSESGSWFVIKMLSNQYTYCGDKEILRSYL